MRRSFAVLAAFALVAGLGACGSDDTNAVGPPPAIPVGAVPAELQVGGGLTVTANTSGEIAKAFRIPGENSLAKAGAVWELRQGSQLVGVLQLTSLNERADTRDAADRESIRSEVLSGTETQFEIATTPVWTAKDDGRGTYVWFGRQMLGILQVKSLLFESDDAATEMVTTLLQSPLWPELPPEAFEADL